MTAVRRWVYILNVLRAIPEIDTNDEHVEVNGVRLHIMHDFNDDNDFCTYLTDTNTGELYIQYSEDGHPLYLNDWAKEPVQWDEFDYPMYEKE